MTIGSWDPQIEQSNQHFQLDLSILRRFITISENDQLDNIDDLLSVKEQQSQAKLMQLEQQAWSVAEALNDNDITHLMRFFTVAEKLPGWEAEATSPVIWLGKILKQRGTGINRELILWIKANSENQFLPHGALS